MNNNVIISGIKTKTVTNKEEYNTIPNDKAENMDILLNNYDIFSIPYITNTNIKSPKVPTTVKKMTH